MFICRARALVFCATLIVLAALGWLAPAHAAERWKIEELSGTAQVVTPGVAPVALTPGDGLEPGQRVVTGPDGRVVLSRGGSSITVSSNSRMSLPRAEDKGGLATRILHSLGTLLFDVEKRQAQHFEVRTPYLAAVVKGTTFTTSVDASGSAVHVVSGLVEVNDARSGQNSLVRPGQTALSNASAQGLQVLGNGGGPKGESDGSLGVQDSGADPVAPTENTSNNVPATQSAATDASKAPAGTSASAGKPAGVELPTQAEANGTVIAKTLGGKPLDVSAATGGLLRAAKKAGPAKPAASLSNPNGNGVKAGNANPNGVGRKTGLGSALAKTKGAKPSFGGGPSKGGGAKPDLGGGSPKGGGAKANLGGGSAKGGGAKPDLGGGSPKGGGAKPDLGGGSPKAGGAKPNLGGGSPKGGGAKSNPGGGSPNAGGSKPDLGGGNPNAGGGTPNVGGGPEKPGQGASNGKGGGKGKGKS